MSRPERGSPGDSPLPSRETRPRVSSHFSLHVFLFLPRHAPHLPRPLSPHPCDPCISLSCGLFHMTSHHSIDPHSPEDPAWGQTRP